MTRPTRMRMDMPVVVVESSADEGPKYPPANNHAARRRDKAMLRQAIRRKNKAKRRAGK